MSHIDQLSKDGLLVLLQNFAKNWLAHDGLWFQAVEQEHGLDHAMELDARAWEQFSPIEARRIKQLLELPDHGGLEALRKALDYRLYSVLNTQSSELEDGKLRFYMKDCRVQTARQRRGLEPFPCKSVGMVEYSTFAVEIDSRIKTRCISCPPDRSPGDFSCGWEFWIE